MTSVWIENSKGVNEWNQPRFYDFFHERTQKMSLKNPEKIIKKNKFVVAGQTGGRRDKCKNLEELCLFSSNWKTKFSRSYENLISSMEIEGKSLQ